MNISKSRQQRKGMREIKLQSNGRRKYTKMVNDALGDATFSEPLSSPPMSLQGIPETITPAVDYGTIDEISDPELPAREGRVDIKQSGKQKERQLKNNKLEGLWNASRDVTLQAYISSYARSSRHCSHCHIPLPVMSVCCAECKAELCPSCDHTEHVTRPFHGRKFWNGSYWTPLPPTQFVLQLTDEELCQYAEQIAVPVIKPGCCQSCGSSPGKITIISSDEDVIVVGLKGRYDLSKGLYSCSGCHSSWKVGFEDFIKSGYWPAYPSDLTPCYYTTELLETWNHLKHRSPGTTESGFLENLSKMSELAARNGSINRLLFAKAAEEFAVAQYNCDRLRRGFEF